MFDMNKDNENDRIGFVCKWVLIFIVALMVAFVFTGCNTMKGLAQDVYAVTEGIQNEMSKEDSTITSVSYRN